MGDMEEELQASPAYRVAEDLREGSFVRKETAVFLWKEWRGCQREPSWTLEPGWIPLLYGHVIGVWPGLKCFI